MISHLYCIRILTTYCKWGYSRTLSTLCKMGVQAQLSKVGGYGWLHFFYVGVVLTEP